MGGEIQCMHLGVAALSEYLACYQKVERGEH